MTKQGVVIAHSLYSPDIIGGAEISTQILAETLNKNFDVNVITVGSHNEHSIINSEINGVKVSRLPYSNLYWIGDTQKSKSTIEKIRWRIRDIYNYQQYRNVKKLFKSMNPSVLHTQNLSGLSLSIWKAAYELNIPIVHTLRDFSILSPINIKGYSYFYRMVSKSLSTMVSSVIGISKDVLNTHINSGLFQNTKQYIVHNVVEENDNVKTLYQNKKVKDGPISLGYFGQLAQIKGVNFLINAVKKIPRKYVAKVFICGDGVELESLKKMAETDDRFIFTGKLNRSETYRIMSSVDLTVVPSIWSEPFGRVIIESYQVGTPVIASKIGGIPEVLINSDYSFPPRNEDAIIEAISKYFNFSIDMKENIKTECHMHSKNFSTDSLLRAHVDIYNELIERSYRKER